MTTAMCYRPKPSGGVSLDVLEEPSAHHQPNPLGGGVINGPRDISAVKMLRISVTDVCNLRCLYCRPEEGVAWLPKSEILSFEEIAAITRASVRLGISHFKLTGGEPTARKDLPVLVEMLRRIPGVEDLSLTTNGILLKTLLGKLQDAGLNRLTVSLDSLRPDRFAAITRGGDFFRVWNALESALRMNFTRLKINVVVMRGMNDDEIADFAALTLHHRLTVRFIEFMPLGRSGLTDDPQSAVVGESEIRQRIEREHGPFQSCDRSSELGVGPAKVYALPGAAGRIGFISAMSAPFCDTCNRLRLTPDGMLRSCLFDGGEVDLKPILRHLQPPAPPGDHTHPPRLRPVDGDLQSRESSILRAMTDCVTFKPLVHSFHGNKAMNRIGG